MISSFTNLQNNLRPLSSKNVLKDQKPTTSVFQIAHKNSFNGHDPLREFGKDITNVSILTVSIPNENVNTLNNVLPNEIIGEKKIKNLPKQKDDLTNKVKNYEMKAQSFIYPMRSQTLRVGTVIHEINEEELTDISMRYDNIVNNDIITGECLKSDKKAVNKQFSEEIADKMIIDEEKFEEMTLIDTQIKIQDRELTSYSNPQKCKEYIADIYSHLKLTEPYFLPKSNYMSSQPDINEKMRGILIDWLIEVHLKYKLVPETMYLTVNLIDRYLEQKPTMRNKLQLVGVASMFIACKYEEIFAPEVGDFVYITDNAYKKSEVIKMESDILLTLGYNVTIPSPYRILEIYNDTLQFDQTIFFFAWYLIELTLIDIKMLKYLPSLIAASACLISLKMMKMYSDDNLDKVTGYTEDQLKDCSRDICALLQNTEKSSLQSIKKKFSLPKYFEVSKIKYL